MNAEAIMRYAASLLVTVGLASAIDQERVCVVAVTGLEPVTYGL